MYIENPEGNQVGIIGEQQAKAAAEAIEKDRERGREFLRQMGEDDSDEAVQDLIDELFGKA